MPKYAQNMQKNMQKMPKYEPICKYAPKCRNMQKEPGPRQHVPTQKHHFWTFLLVAYPHAKHAFACFMQP